MDTQQYRRLMPLYSPTTPVSQGTTSPQINASLPDSSWHPNHQPSPNNSPSSAQPAQMYSLVNRSSDHVDYASLSASFISQHQPGSYSPPEHPQSSHPDPLDQDMSQGLTQVDSSIGPSRILTRRQRALLQQGGRRASGHSSASAETIDTNSVRPLFKFWPEPPIAKGLTSATLPNVFYDL